MRHGLTLLALFAAMLSARTAHADCAAPRAFFAVGQGEVPVYPVIHYFEPLPQWGGEEPAPPVFTAQQVVSRAGAGVDAPSLSIPLRVEPLPAPSAWRTYRIQVLMKHSGRVEVRAGAGEDRYGREPPKTLLRVETDLERDWKPALKVTGTVEKRFLWPCSFTLGAQVSLETEAPVVRFEWAGSREAFEAGQREVLYFPTGQHPFFGGREGTTELVLGHQSCLGPTFAWPESRIYGAFAAIGPAGAVAANPVPILVLERPENLKEHLGRWYPER